MEPKPQTPRQIAASERESRIAESLRENLRRRKMQAQARLTFPRPLAGEGGPRSRSGEGT